MRHWLRVVAAGIGVFVGVGLCGWIFGMPVLLSWTQSGTPMSAGGVICFVLIAAGLLAWSSDRVRWACGAWLGVVAIAGSVLALRLGGADQGMDPLFQEKARSLLLNLPGKMPVNTATAFVSLAFAFMGLVMLRRMRWLVLLPTGAVLFLAVLAIFNGVTGLRAANGEALSMPLPTAFLLVVVGGTLIQAVARFHRGLGYNSPPALFTIAAVLLLACGRMSHAMNHEISEVSRAVTAAFELRDSMHEYALVLTRMEAADRAYSLTGNDSYAAQQAGLAADSKRIVERLEREAGDDARRREQMVRLKRLTMQRIEESDASILARKSGDTAGHVQKLESTVRENVPVDPPLVPEENQILREREQLMLQIERQAEMVLTAGVLVAVFLLAATFYLLHRARRALQISHMALERRVIERTAELQRSEESLRFLADTMPQMVWTTRRDGAVSTFNRGWHEYTGLNLEQSLEDWTQALHPDDRAPFAAGWANALVGGREGRGEYRLRRASDGMHRWHLWRARPQRDRVGNLVRWVGTSTDLHDQKEAAQALERAVAERTLELAAATQELEEVNRLQRAVLDGTVFGLIAVNKDGVIQIFNTGAEYMLGWQREEVVGRHTPTLFHDKREIAARAVELTQELGRGVEPGFEAFVARVRLGEVDEREWTFVRKDGTHFPVLLSVTALRDKAGAITGFMGVAHNLTRSKAAEDALRISRERLGSIFGAMAEGLVMQDEQGTIIECNAAAGRILGLTSAQIMGRNAFDPDWGLIREDGCDFPGSEHPSIITLRTGEPMRGVVMGVRKADGSLLWISVNSEPIRDEQGRVRAVVCSFSDITQRKIQAAELRDSEERFRQSFEFAGIGMALVGLDGRWLQVNQALCQILGYSAEEFFTKTFQDITHPDDLENDLVLLRELLGGKSSFYQMEKRYFHRDGHVVWGRLTVTLVRGSGGEPVHFVSQIENITERKGLEENLARARDEALTVARLKSEFLANMSHEIRTPMNGVLGMARLLMDTKLASEQRRMGQVVLSSAENLLTIIDDILDFSKIEAGKMRIDPHGFDLVKLVRETTELLASQARVKGLALVCETGGEKSCGLIGDSGRIRQVLTNLLGNALKFTAHGGVEVKLRLGDEVEGRRRMSLSVSDSGIGISPQVQTRLFQPFIQAEPGGRKYGGTGLGLAICRQLVDLMGGRIGCESSEGVGSRFWFDLELPVWAADAGEKKTDNNTRGRGGLRLLVAEDNHANQMVVRLTLERMGHEVVIVGNGREALDTLAREKFDAVLMDCQMPEMDGYEAVRRLREGSVAGADRGVPVIALTAYALPGDKARCLAAGMNEYVTKPLSADQLRQALARCGLDAGKPRAVISAETAPPFEGAQPQVLDERQVAKLSHLKAPGGEPLPLHLFAMLLREMPGRMMAMRAAVETREDETLMRTAHTLAGSCANLGAFALGSVARELEEAGRCRDWLEASGCLTRLGAEWERLRAELSRRFPSLRS
jgi:PAS domain S-box-containing protein